MSSIKNIKNLVLTTGLSRILGLLRDVLIITSFGISFVSSAFIYAFTLPNLFRRLLGEGALNSAFMPVLASSLKEDEKKQVAFDFVNRLISWQIIVLVFLISIGLITFISLGQSSSFSKESILGFNLSALMLPYMLFICICAIISSTLNSLGKFVVASLSAVWLNVIMIISLLIGNYFFSSQIKIVWILSISVLLGGFLQFFIPFLSLKKIGWKYKFSLKICPKLKEVFWLFIPSVLAGAVVQINILVSRNIAFYVDESAVSLLYLANRLVEFPIGLFSIAIATVIFPKMASFFANNDKQNYIKTFIDGISLVLAITIPAFVGLTIFGEEILNLLFQWKNFTQEDLIKTLPVLYIFALEIPIISVTIITLRALHSSKNMKKPLYISIVAFALNVIFSFLFIKYQATGLALANVISAFIQLVFLVYFFLKEQKIYLKKQMLALLFWDILKTSFACIVMLLIGFSIKYINIADTKILSGLKLGLGIFLCIFIYIALLKILKHSKFKQVSQLLFLR